METTLTTLTTERKIRLQEMANRAYAYTNEIARLEGEELAFYNEYRAVVVKSSSPEAKAERKAKRAKTAEKYKKYADYNASKKARTLTPAQAAADAIAPIAMALRTLNHCQSGATRELWENKFAEIQSKAEAAGNSFIASVCETCLKYRNVSEKQADCIASFVIKNKIEL